MLLILHLSNSHSFYHILFIFGFTSASILRQKTKDLHIMGLFPMTGTAWPGGYATKTATEMAIEEINNRSDILPEYKLNLHSVDSKVRIQEFLFCFKISIFHCLFSVYCFF